MKHLSLTVGGTGVCREKANDGPCSLGGLASFREGSYWCRFWPLSILLEFFQGRELARGVEISCIRSA